MLYTTLITSALVIVLVAVAGVLMVTEKTRALRPFDREVTIPLRGLLAISILTAHMVPDLYSISLPVVATFFLLSGYGLCMSFKNKGGAYLRDFASRRCSKLLPAFVTLSLISALVGRTLRRTGYLLVGFTLAYIYLTREVLHWASYWYTTIPAVIFGYGLALYEDRIERLVKRHTLAVYVSAVAMVALSFYGKIKLVILIHIPFEIWLFFWAISVALAFYLIIRTLGMIRWRPLVWLGIISMEIYLVHGLLLIYIGKALSGLDPGYDGFGYIAYIIAGYVLSLIAAYIIHKIFARPDKRRFP